MDKTMARTGNYHASGVGRKYLFGLLNLPRRFDAAGRASCLLVWVRRMVK